MVYDRDRGIVYCVYYYSRTSVGLLSIHTGNQFIPSLENLSATRSVCLATGNDGVQLAWLPAAIMKPCCSVAWPRIPATSLHL